MSRILKRILALLTLIGAEMAILGLVAFACIAIFLYTAKVVFINQNNALDAAAFAWVAKQRTPAFTSFMKFVTFFASKDFLIYSSLGLAGFFLFFKQHRWYSVKVPVIAAGSSLLNQALKAWFNRPRPKTALFEQTGLSFPSGHAMIGGAFYGLLIYLVWTKIKVKTVRWLVAGLLFLWILLIGYSRVYFNVHYASDVLAGWAAGFLFLIISLLILRRFEPKYAREAKEMLANTEAEESNSNGLTN